MKFFKGIGNVSLTQKICLAGLFAATATILQKVIAINYLANLPFFRISFGAPAIIVFSSIFLGPLWGAAVGAFSDLIGYFAFDMSGYGFFPLITLIYLVLGLTGYFIFKLIDKIGNEKRIFLIEIIVLLCLFLGISLYIIFGYDCSLAIKICIPIGLFLLLALFTGFQIWSSSRQGKLYTPIKLSFTYFLLDFFVLVIFGTLMKAISFNAMGIYFEILITQSLVMIFNVVFNSILLATFFRLTKKYME